MEQFTWIPFFEELADKLLEYKNNRQALLDFIYKIPAKYVKYLHEEDGSELDDICPFTVIGIMNRNQTFDNRIKIMSLFKQHLGIKANIPADFVGIPTLNPQRSWFFGYENVRKQHDIDNLWSLFQAAIEYADKGNEHETEFISCYNTAMKQYSVKWNITQGLYWIRPNFYVSLDGPSRTWMENNGITGNLGNNPPSGHEYLEIRRKTEQLARKGYNGMKSIPEFIADAFEKAKICEDISTTDMEGIDNDELNKMLKLLEHKKQIILQGAPGTGKTYTTATLAVALCDGKENLPGTRKEIMERYDELVADKSIAFTTFHQSMDYEEFVEGIKPVKNDDGSITYDVMDGLFKKICKEADYIETDTTGNEIIRQYPTIWKVSLQGTGDNPTRTDCMANGRIRIGWDEYGRDITEDTDYSKYGGKNVLDAFINKMQKGDYVLSCYSSTTIDAIGIIEGDYEWLDNVSEYKRSRKVKWLVKGIKENIYELNGNTALTLSTVYKLNNITYDKLNQLLDKYKIKKLQQPDNDDKLPFVLIIDEINRGNVSKIFGELITLLEADKRLGAENEVTVTLPYSGDSFGVPSNLYIIGTMNTADRSVGYIDYAVRRRFAFFTIKASRKAIESYYGDNDELCDVALGYFDEVSTLFDNVSNEFDKDDVMVGHSYFMAENKDELDLKMEYEVRPLLLEYVRDGVLNIRKDSDEYKKIANYPASPETTANDDDN